MTGSWSWAAWAGQATEAGATMGGWVVGGAQLGHLSRAPPPSRGHAPADGRDATPPSLGSHGEVSKLLDA